MVMALLVFYVNCSGGLAGGHKSSCQAQRRLAVTELCAWTRILGHIGCIFIWAWFIMKGICAGIGIKLSISVEDTAAFDGSSLCFTD